MNRSARLRFVALAALAFACLLRPACAQTTTPAVVTTDRTNLRAQPSKEAEVLASLVKGESVEVLGVVTPKGGKEAWSRVAMPPSVKVWLYGPLVDKAGVIRGETGNFRAGPGRNYSVLGRVRRGDNVKIVREFDGWVQIEPPAGAVAYVASHLLDTTPAAPAAANSAPAPASPAAPASEPPPPVAAASEPAAAVSPPPPTATQSSATASPIPASPPLSEPAADATAAAKPTEPEPALAPPVADPVPAAAARRPRFGGSPRDQSNQPPPEEQHAIVTSTDAEPAPLKLDPALAPSRQVQREGIVRATLSPQAPTDYELRGGFRGEGTIDYLYLSPQKELGQYSGKRVLVSGEEYRDSRWRTPVLKIQTIELLEPAP